VLPAGVTSLQRINCNLDRPLFKISKPLIMKKILLLLLTFSLFFACNKDDEPTPENWTEDDNIFRCKVNGVDWEPEGDGVSFSGGNLDIYYEKYILNAIQVSASKDNNDVNEFMTMFIGTKPNLIGEHLIGTTTIYTNNSCGNYFRDTLADNIVNILEVDSVNFIMEGKFKFTGINSSCLTNKVVITDGYFKAKYRN
jgi:hypothetical protein